MRILIGTPVHASKDYCMEKWLKAVSKFTYPCDLLMVDNSPDLDYVNTITRYCQSQNLTNYRIVHITVAKDALLDDRLAQSREVIRQTVLTQDYDAWCSLECDVIAPPDALSKLVGLLEDNWMVSHTYPARKNPAAVNEQLGIALIRRSALEKYGFIDAYGYVNPKQPKSWYGSDVWFIRQIDLDPEGKRINVSGIIQPILHLDK